MIPRGPSTVSYRNEACFASPLWDCTAKLSGEHPVGRKLLRVLSGAKKSITVSGHPTRHAQPDDEDDANGQNEARAILGLAP